MDGRGETTRRQLLRMLAAGSGASLLAPALGGLLEACSGSSSAPRRGGTVSIAIATEPNVLNPPIHILAIESTVMSAIFPGLLRMRADGTLVPELARGQPQVADGGLAYRFQLREGLRWEDGRSLTAHDFLFTQQLYLDPRTKPSYVLGWDKIDRVETPDPTTVVYRLREAFAPFLQLVAASPVLPRHVLESSQDLRKDPFSRAPVGAGPFRLRRWDTGSQLVLEANPRYWQGRPALDHLVFKVVPDVATQVNQLRAGEVDVIGVGQPALLRQLDALRSDIRTAAYDDTRYVMVQLDEYGALRELAVRQALDYATPKRDIVRSILDGQATVAYADVPPGSPYYQPDVEHHDYDPDRARSVLQQAGFAMRDGVMTRNGQPLEVGIYTVSTVPTYVQIAQVLKSTWSAIGVRTSVTTMEATTLFSNRGPQWNGRDAALIYGFDQGVDPYNYINWSSKQITNDETDPGQNNARYVNPTIDDLVVRGGQVLPFDQRRQVYDQIQRILAHDVPVIFLYWPKSIYAYSARLRGFAPNAFAGLLNGVERWSRG